MTSQNSKSAKQLATQQLKARMVTAPTGSQARSMSVKAVKGADLMKQHRGTKD